MGPLDTPPPPSPKPKVEEVRLSYTGYSFWQIGEQQGISRAGFIDNKTLTEKSRLLGRHRKTYFRLTMDSNKKTVLIEDYRKEEQGIVQSTVLTFEEFNQQLAKDPHFLEKLKFTASSMAPESPIYESVDPSADLTIKLPKFYNTPSELELSKIVLDTPNYGIAQIGLQKGSAIAWITGARREQPSRILKDYQQTLFRFTIDANGKTVLIEDYRKEEQGIVQSTVLTFAEFNKKVRENPYFLHRLQFTASSMLPPEPPRALDK